MRTPLCLLALLCVSAASSAQQAPSDCVVTGKEVCPPGSDARAFVATAASPTGGASLSNVALDGTPRGEAVPTVVAADGRASGGVAGRSVHAVHVDAPPLLDGRLDEAAWSGAPVLTDFRQVTPMPGQAASRPTEVRLLYTDDALYIGARLHEPASEAVVARLFRRDSEGYSDWFTVYVDSYDDGRTAFAFGVNPRGVQRDALIADEQAEDATWDAIWHAETTIDAAGWSAEIRIPFSQLRFRSVDPERGWGVNFTRTLASLDETVSWSPLSRDDARTVSLFGRLTGLAALRPPVGVEVIPYAASSLSHAAADPADPFATSYGAAARVGADLRYRLTTGLTLSATVNPDFGQVEADPAVINLTAFESFFPEQRGFFLEGADAFRVRGPELFYSRRIGRSPQGYQAGATYAAVPEASTILGATKVTGRVGAWTVGALGAVTDREMGRFGDADGVENRAVIEPATGYGVARARWASSDGRTTVGTIGTGVYRTDVAEPSLAGLRRDALAGGVDVTHRLEGEAYEVSASLFGSRVGGSVESITATQLAPQHNYGRPDADHLTFDPSRTALGGYSALGSVAKLSGPLSFSVSGFADSPGFEINDLGYLRRADQAGEEVWAGYTTSLAAGPLRTVEVSTYHSAWWSFGGEPLGARVAPRVRATFRSLWSGSLGAEYGAAGLDVDALRGGPALRTDPYVSAGASLATDPRPAASGSAVVQLYDGVDSRYRAAYAQLGVAYRPSTWSTLSVEVPVGVERNPMQLVGLGADGTYFVGEVEQRTVALTLRAETALSPTLSVQAYAQPFVGSGRYSRYGQVAAPRAARFEDRIAAFGDRAVVTPDGVAVDGEVAFGSPDFTVLDLRSNVVARWAFRPGSTVYLAWSRGQSGYEPVGSRASLADLPNVLRLDARDVVLLKWTTTLGL